MASDYSPPFSISPLVLNLVAEITGQVGMVAAKADSGANLRLRRINRIRTPDHPRSPRQRYRLTAAGKRFASAQAQE